MIWQHYYVNNTVIAGPEARHDVPFIVYNSKIPPHGSIRREWITYGMKHADAMICFVEYRLEDDDIDGVWEAYGMKRESEYSFTVDAQKADPEKLFVYTLYEDGSLQTGFDIDTDKALAILVFPTPQNITAAQLAAVAQRITAIPWQKSAEADEILLTDILGGNTNVLCLGFFRR